MKLTKKRMLTWLLALVLVFGLLPGVWTAAAAEDGAEPRDTEFFTSQEHTELNYDEIVYTYIDPAELLAEMDALRELCGDGANTGEFRSRFLALAEEEARQRAMYEIVLNQRYADSGDLWAAQETEKVYADKLEIQDALTRLIRDALSSPCAAAFDDLLTPGQRAYYLSYADMSEELLDLYARESALQSEYMTKVLNAYTAVYEGVEYTVDGAYEAYRRRELSYDEYALVNSEAHRNKNAVLGEIFVRMVEVRRQIAELSGYDSYGELADRITYSRDYSAREAQEFREAVKTYIAPLYHALSAAQHTPVQSEMPEDVVYSGPGMFETLLPCFARLSDELTEATAYVYAHGAYDVDPAPTKTSTAYSVCIPYYNMPYYFNNAYGNWQDLLNTIHEMGHNNEYYWHPNDWNSPGLCYDTAETESQGLELLMLPFYPELFGGQADAVQTYTVNDILSSIVSGAEYDEFQRRVYALPELTLEAVNRTFRQVAEEYGFVSADDERTELYSWVDIPHNFLYPFYYLSYATSAAGAFAFWEAAQEDWYAAVDDYLRFTAIGREQGFADTFRAIGMESPIGEEYIRHLAELIREKLMYVSPFTDVYMDDWCGSYVSFVYYFGVMNGVSADRFEPNGFATRAQCMTVMARCDSVMFDGPGEEITLEAGAAWAVETGISDGSSLSGTLTREQLAAMFYRYAQYLGLDVSMGEETDLLGFEDAADISGWAEDAVAWAYAVGLLEETSIGRIAPRGEITRAYLAKAIQYFWWSIY